jgi:hypothetical protein
MRENIKNYLLNQSAKHADEIERFYENCRMARSAKQVDIYWPLWPSLGDDDFTSKFIQKFGEDEARKLTLYLLQNDKRLEATDTYDDYHEYEPYPSYFILYAYDMLLKLENLDIELLDAFWLNQSQIRPGLDVDISQRYLNRFIEQGVTTRDEIRERLIQDWWSWQRGNKPYFGPSGGITTWYFGWKEWPEVVKRLEKEWFDLTGEKAKNYMDEFIYTKPLDKIKRILGLLKY